MHMFMNTAVTKVLYNMLQHRLQVNIKYTHYSSGKYYKQSKSIVIISYYLLLVQWKILISLS